MVIIQDSFLQFYCLKVYIVRILLQLVLVPKLHNWFRDYFQAVFVQNHRIAKLRKMQINYAIVQFHWTTTAGRQQQHAALRAVSACLVPACWQTGHCCSS
jgi:hypothetical protein